MARLGTLIQQLEHRLGQHTSGYYERAYLVEVLNRAYLDILAEIDATGFVVRSGDDYEDLSVDAGAREYSLTTAARRIVEVHRVLSSSREVPVDIRPFSDRDRAPWASSSDCYVYPMPGDKWVVGLMAQSPPAQTLRVRYAPMPDELVADVHSPTLVPSQYHDVIVLRAAIIVLDDGNREMGSLPGIYGDRLQKLCRAMRDAHRSYRSRPLRGWRF
jgi:hypothetical protein